MRKNEYKRQWGDRKDGRWLRELDGLHLIMPFLFPKRTESEVYSLEQVNVSKLVKYVEEKNLANPEMKTTPFHLVVAAIAKALEFRPYLNRFVAGGRTYERFDKTLSFIVKRQFADHAKESIMVLKTRPDMTLNEISRRIIGDTDKLRKEDSSDVNGMMETVGKWPRWLNRLFFALVRLADYYGLMPEVVTKGDPEYSSVLLANLGSIKCNAVYHHLNNYGTNSIVITIGEISKSPIVDEEGNVVIADVMNLGCTLDERIADGFYFAKSIKFVKYLLENPELLENTIESETGYVFK